jgi:hypothetical protein
MLGKCFVTVLYPCIYFFAVLGFVMGFFETGSLRMALNCDPPNLCLLSS